MWEEELGWGGGEGGEWVGEAGDCGGWVHFVWYAFFKIKKMHVYIINSSLV